MSYYNTTNQKGTELKSNQEKAKTQDELILEFFKKSPEKHLSPTDLWRRLFQDRCPLTSVRRSFNTLTNDGYIKKTGYTKHGMYGRKEYCWMLSE